MTVFDSNAKAIVFKNTLYLLASFLLNQGLRFLYIIVIARILVPDDLGLLTYGQSWYLSFLPFCMLGLGAVLVKAVAQGKSYGRKVTNHVFIIRVFSVLTCAILSAGVSLLWHQSSEIINLTLVFSLALLGRGAWMWCENMLIAYEKVYYKFHLEKYLRPLELISAAAIAYLSQDIILIAISHALIWCLQGAIGVYLVFKKVRKVTPVYSPRFSFQILKKAWPMAVAVVADMLVLQLIFIVYKNIGGLASEIANLVINIQLIIIASSIFSAFNQSVSHRVAVAADRSPKELNKFLAFNMNVICAFTILAVFLSSYLGGPLLLWLIGENYAVAIQNLPISMFIILPYVLKYTSATVFQGLGILKQTLVMNVITLLTMIISLPLLFEEFGFVGAILSLLLAYSASVLYSISYFYFNRYLEFRKHLLIPCLAITVLVIAFLLSNNMSATLGLTIMLLSSGTTLLLLYFNTIKLKNDSQDKLQ